MRDVVVAGGGPIGLAAALHAHRAGLSVVVREPRAGAIDKACGEGLMPGAVAELAALGVHEVHDVGTCTACSPRHWSYRARADRARQAVVAWLPA